MSLFFFDCGIEKWPLPSQIFGSSLHIEIIRRIDMIAVLVEMIAMREVVCSNVAPMSLHFLPSSDLLDLSCLDFSIFTP